MSAYKDPRKQALRDGIVPYLNNGLVDELTEDLRSILRDAEQEFLTAIDDYAKARRILCGDRK